MIVTLTPNPSVDRTLEISSLERGEVVRSTRAFVEPGGKGVNVARALAKNGVPVSIVIPVGGPDGAQLEGLIDDLALPHRSVRIDGSVRANVSLVEPDGTVTKVNAPGPHLSPDEIAALVESSLVDVRQASWLAGCGSLPPGVSNDFYAELTLAAKSRGANIAIDTSGPALAGAVDAAPDVIKPNDLELAELTGQPLTTLRDVVEAARSLNDAGVRAVLVSLGADGAVLVESDLALHAWSDPVAPRSNVGAGDATLAGFLAGGGTGADALRLAVAFGTAAVQLPGSAMPGPDQIHKELIHVSDVDLDRGLRQGGGTS